MISSMIIDANSQSESNKKHIADCCQMNLKDITIDCVGFHAFFVCLKSEKSIHFSTFVPDKTIVIIALGRLHATNGIFHGVDLPSGGSVVVSGDKPQHFDGGNPAGGLGIALRTNFKSTPREGIPQGLQGLQEVFVTTQFKVSQSTPPVVRTAP